MATERNREETEGRLLKAIGELIDTQGFENTGVNAVSEKSGLSKVLIYRYFGSMDGLLSAYIEKNDFWINFPESVPDKQNLPQFIKEMFAGQINQLKNNSALRKLCRWELSSNNDIVKKLRKRREDAGIKIIRAVAEASGRSENEIAAVATIISSSITYLFIFSDTCDEYNGLNLKNDNDIQSLRNEIFEMVDLFFS